MILLTINGQAHALEVAPDTPLVFVLRNELGLTGAKIGCASEQCGACAVLVNGESTLSCVRPVADFVDQKVVTIEGLAEDAVGRSVQQAFIEEGAAQCGYCTPGMVIATTALLNQIRRPTAADIHTALDRHLCRCGSQPRVLAAIQRVIDRDT
jgi:aerobic-type carbon monoxide dehydrogenase small subunit (CoxS/CutS family)